MWENNYGGKTKNAASLLLFLKKFLKKLIMSKQNESNQERVVACFLNLYWYSQKLPKEQQNNCSIVSPLR